MSTKDKSPSDVLFSIDKWLLDNISPSHINNDTHPHTKKDWQDILKKNRKLGNAEEGAALAGELLHLVHSSRSALQKYTKEMSGLQREISALKEKDDNHTMVASSLKDMITEEIGNIVPEIVKQIESKLLPGEGNSTQPKDTRNKEKHALIIEQKNQSGEAQSFSPKQWSDVLKGPVSQKLNEIPVDKSSLTTDGKGYVSFPDRKSRDTAAEALKNDFVIVERDRTSRTLLPKMRICDLKDFKKDDTEKLKLNIPKKNPKIKSLIDKGATLDIIFIREPLKPDHYGYAVIRVDPKIREEIIKNQRKLFMDTTSYYVKDHVHVTQCFSCQQFGHKKGSPHCTNKDTEMHTCLYCAQNHESRSCKLKNNISKHRCANCLKTQKFGNTSNHTSTSYECPILTKEINSVIRRTVCDTKNFPIQRVSQRQ